MKLCLSLLCVAFYSPLGTFKWNFGCFTTISAQIPHILLQSKYPKWKQNLPEINSALCVHYAKKPVRISSISYLSTPIFMLLTILKINVTWFGVCWWKFTLRIKTVQDAMLLSLSCTSCLTTYGQVFFGDSWRPTLHEMNAHTSDALVRAHTCKRQWTIYIAAFDSFTAIHTNCS